MTYNYSVALFGCGYWGKNVLRNLIKFNGLNISVIDINKNIKNQVKELNVRVYENIDQVLSNTKIDIGIICVPVSRHFQITKKLLENKIHVACQKPLVETAAQAQDLTETAKKNNVKLMTCFTYVFNSGIRKLSELLPEIGKKYYYDSTRINLGIIQRDCGIVHDLACHDFAILYYLTNKLPEYISATGEVHNKNGFIDVANISMGYENGFHAHIHCNWLSPIKNRTIILAGDKKMVTFDDCSNEKIKIYDTGFSPKGDVFDYRTGDILIPKIENTEAIQLELKHFFDSIQYDMEPLTNGGFSIQVLKMIEAANKSIERKGEPIVP